MTWHRISLPWATFGVEVKDGRVVWAPAIARWCTGKRWSFVKEYWRGRGAEVIKLRRHHIS